MKRKYVTTQMESYCTAGIEITRAGFVTEDEKLIELLDNSSDLGMWYFSVPTEEDTKREAEEWARAILGDDDVKSENDYVEPVEVEPMSAGNIDEELEALAEETRIREADAQAAAEALEASRQKDLSYKERFKPNAAAKKKAALAAKAEAEK